MADIDFGSDISTVPDLDPAFRPISGQQVLAQALMRRLSTPRGALPFNPDDGLDLNDWLHRGIDTTTLYRLKNAVKAECEKDERVYAVAVSLSPSARLDALTIRIQVEPVTGQEFSMTARLTAFDFSLLSVE